ncbi:MAG: DUF3124 domain-containing protein [Desulfococcaceae bacterium]|jgi:hypothetical protein|nr:DUF3124 domain-containing protein [Desulfococcaceae bacterium]
MNRKIPASVLFLVTVIVMNLQGAYASEIPLSRGQSVYIAVYSHIYSGDREHRFDLAATLSIRNTDMRHPITVFSVTYYDSEGKKVSEYLTEPVQIAPLGTIRYTIKESDKRGGSGANFLVKWKSGKAVNIPIMESIMIGTKNQQGISFTSRGQVLQEK